MELVSQSQAMTYNQGNYIWWMGTVVNVEDDPHMNGRIRVRIHGWYDDVEDEELPWCIPLGLIHSESHKGIGFSPTGIQKDSKVIGFFLDGADGQVPIYVGSLYGMPQGEADTHKNAREKQDIKRKELYKGKEPEGGIFTEPDTKFKAKYPYNHVRKTLHGHIFELDDTEGQQRFHYRHPSETDFEIDKDGEAVLHIVKNGWIMVKDDTNIHTGRNIRISVGENAMINIEGNARINVEKNVKTTVKGNYELKVDGNMKIDVVGNTDFTTNGIKRLKGSMIYLN